jgi:hypothetical protein
MLSYSKRDQTCQSRLTSSVVRFIVGTTRRIQSEPTQEKSVPMLAWIRFHLMTAQRPGVAGQ